jgi:hypothetical protein
VDQLIFTGSSDVEPDEVANARRSVEQGGELLAMIGRRTPGRVLRCLDNVRTVTVIPLVALFANGTMDVRTLFVKKKGVRAY